ncbi:MAG: hypothetical protein KKC18_06865 [Chloroflexi bacterium]|nr:hypothetical protein [Chloroflexota bacterium]
MNKSDSFYYHAGCGTADIWRWSEHTRHSHRTAAAEARKMARRYGGRPIVEWWDREHGMRPGDQNAVIDAGYVDEKLV